MVEQTQTQAVPTTPSAPAQGGGEQLNDTTLKGMEAQMRPKESLAPLKVNPKAKVPGMGTSIAAGALSMFVPFLGAAVQQHAKMQKEAQINEASNEFSSLNDALEMASTMAQMEALQKKIPEDKVQERTQELWKEQPGYKALFDPMNPAAKKRLKNFAKVFQQDWLNPEKAQSTVHAQGLKRFMQLKPHSALIKHLGQKMVDGQQQGGQGGPAQPGGQPQQAQPQQQQPQQGSPSDGLQHRMSMPDPKELTPYASYLKAADDMRNHLDLKFDAGGKPFTFDKRTGETKEVRVTKADGSGSSYVPTMMTQGRKGVATADGVPFGVYGQTDSGQWGIVTPNMNSWTGDMAKEFEAANAAWAKGEASKDHRVKVSAEWRAKAWAATRVYSVYDTKDGSMQMVNSFDITGNRGRYTSSTVAMQLTNRKNLFNEIEGTEKALKATIDKMGDTPFDEITRAQLAVALKSDSPNSAVDAFLKTNAAGTLTEAQVEYVTAIAAMKESAMSLRSLGGMGAGSDQMRDAIMKMLPGAGTPSGKYAKRQLELFDIEVKGLKKDQPKLGGGGDKAKKKMDF